MAKQLVTQTNYSSWLLFFETRKTQKTAFKRKKCLYLNLLNFFGFCDTLVAK